MTKPMIRIHDTSTDEIVDREMTDEEYAQYQADKVAEQQTQVKAEQKATNKIAVLNRLGVTEDELAAIFQ
jgi:hypothetical protein